MSRTKRIEKKVAYLGQYIESAACRNKTDYALTLAKKIAVLNNKALEAYLDECIADSRRILVDYRTGAVPTADGVEYVMLMPDHEGKPVVEVKQGSRFYYFPLTNGFQVHICNGFLRSLDLGIDIHFESYLQYGNMLMECSELLEKRKALA